MIAHWLRLVKPVGMSLALGTDVHYGHGKYPHLKKYCTAGYVTVQHSCQRWVSETSCANLEIL